MDGWGVLREKGGGRGGERDLSEKYVDFDPVPDYRWLQGVGLFVTDLLHLVLGSASHCR